MPHVYTFRELVRVLKDYDPRFYVDASRGKGSHRSITHPDIAGRLVAYPVKYHGDGTEIRRGTLSDIVRVFRLPRGVL